MNNGFLSNNLHQIKIDLLEFWDKTGGKINYGKGYSSQYKLDLLKEYSNKIYFKRTKSRERMRRKFSHIRLRFLKLPCFICEIAGEIRHHIILLNHGGDNRKINLLALCKKCHSKIHPWLNINQPETLRNASLAL